MSTRNILRPNVHQQGEGISRGGPEECSQIRSGPAVAHVLVKKNHLPLFLLKKNQDLLAAPLPARKCCEPSRISAWGLNCKIVNTSYASCMHAFACMAGSGALAATMGSVFLLAPNFPRQVIVVHSTVVLSPFRNKNGVLGQTANLATAGDRNKCGKTFAKPRPTV